MTTLDLLTTHPFLDGMSRHQLDRLARWSHRSLIHAGHRVFSEGGRAERFWLLRDGEIGLDVHIPGQGDVMVDTLGPGAVLGWSWLFPPHRWQFGATALAHTLTIELDAAGVRALCEEDPVLGRELYHRFITVVVDRLQATRLRLLDMYGRGGS